MALAQLMLDLFIVGLTAMAGGWLCRRFDVPEVLGYLAAGVLLGPALHDGAAFVDTDIVSGIGQFSVVFRMFLLGLDFDPRRLRGRWRPALTAGLLAMGLATLAGVGLAVLLGWPLLTGAVLGAALGTTSTSILSKSLADRNMSAREDARAAGAATLTEDLIAMTLIAAITVFGSSGAGASAIVENAVWLLVFASLAFTAGAIFVPIGLDRLGRVRSDELMTIAVLGILFGFAALSASLRAGPAVGAFLAGIAVGAARHAPGLSQRVIPLRDMLVPIAYVGLGLALNVTIIWHAIPLALALAIAFVVLKTIAVSVGLRLGGVPAVTAARAGAILGQAGTMGIVFTVALALHALDAYAEILAIAFVVWAFTVALTPLRLKYGPDVADRIARALGAGDRIEPKRRLPRRVGGDAERGAAYSLLLALGCVIALAALAALVARADDYAFRDTALRPAIIGLAAVLVGFAAVPFAIASGVAARALFHDSARRAELRPRHLAKRKHEGSRALGHVGAIAGTMLTIVAPAGMIAALAPTDSRVPLAIGFVAGLGLALVRPSLLARLTDECERLVAPRRSSPEPTGTRMHDFRGLNPFGYEVDALLVRSGTVGAWAKLRDLAIPEKTGARVLAVLRPGSHDSAPLGPDTVLHPGDEVVLGGGGNSLVNARRLLLEARSGPLEHDAAADDRRVHDQVQGRPRVS